MSIEQPLFTIATITYNSGQWVKQTIESVLASSYENFEFIISDDCSTDDTWEIIQQYNDPRIKAWRNEKNIGEYPNRNKVLNEARGKYILYVDGDDILYKLSLGNLSNYVEYFPEAGMIWGIEDVFFPNVVYPYLFKPAEVIRFLYTITSSLGYTGMAETVFKTQMLKAAGGLSEKYAMGDIYIKKKLSLTESVLFIPRGIVFWRHSPGQATRRIEKQYSKLVEDITIDREIINSDDFPIKGELKDIINENIKIREAKMVTMNTLRKRKVLAFFKLRKELGIPLWQFRYVFKKPKQNYYLFSIDIKKPIMNEFNFRK